MTRIKSVLVGALLLGGCTLTPEQQANWVYANTKACEGIAGLESLYVAVVAEGAISAGTQATVSKWRVTVDRACANPAGINPITLAGQIGGAFVVISKALKEGEANGSRTAAVGYTKLHNLRATVLKALNQ